MSASPGFMEWKRRALALEAPLSAMLELTYTCNWRCVFCYNPRHHDRRPLSLAEWGGVLEDLRALGTLNVTFTGGEALTHPEFFAIAGEARRLRFAVKLFTNAALVSERIADQLVELGLWAVEASIHGATAEVHDAATGVPGSFEALWRGVDRLRSRGVSLVLKTPLTRLNEHQLPEMIALVDGAGIPYRIDPTLSPRDDGSLEPLGYAASPGAVRSLMTTLASRGTLPALQRRDSEGGANCGLGRITLAVGPEGDVYPCLQWRRAMGNVRVTRLRELWTASQERADAARVSVEANEMLRQRGGPAAAFNYCPARALQTQGDPLQPDAQFFRVADIVDEVRRNQRLPPEQA